MPRAILAFAAGLAACALPAQANDSTAELAAGGLVLTRSAQIQMAQEDLFVSAREVRVHYRFRNLTAQPITVRVAFPMPDVVHSEGPTSLPTQNAANILGFETKVDGVAVKAQVEQKAVLNGKDYTALLIGLHVPLAAHLEASRNAIDRLTPAQKKQLVDLGLTAPQDWPGPNGKDERHYAPQWTLKTTYHWEQTFPAGRDLVVDHRYQPATGASAGTMAGSPGYAAGEEGRAAARRYCVDPAFVAAAAAHRPKGSDYADLTEERVSYVLITGANWAGPIGDFRLVVDKGAAENLVSFCGEGVKRITPTRFEMRKTAFTPKRDLDILILKPRPPYQ